MNMDRYLQMPENYVWSTLTGCGNIADQIFVQDSAPHYFSLTVRAWLDKHFPGRWMGRRGPHERPPRSPDLTPCDFYRWGYTIEEFYKTQSRTLEDSETRTQDFLSDISDDIMQKVVHSIPDRLRKLVNATGAYVEI
ncbi:uncharacterized protein LOC106871051 [Octopus bimaculoides]|uniref:uncharacterized protein LOC106871051 n=1 Tax=Octopus bimaculoides TaxID=37653 RepID=UPI00071C8D1C|nr:uncharacterized protein LOC106871051 [Octopus bimaculoides]|eukprot:XP_014772804.1 PREDICTED: uncharacterized protein LOC106871051 [Octopus bimaculoides]